MYPRCRFINSLDLDTLGQHDSNKPLKVLEWTVSETAAEDDRAVWKLQWLWHRDTPLPGRVTMMPAQDAMQSVLSRLSERGKARFVAIPYIVDMSADRRWPASRRPDMRM
jgi:hypothetical protein